MQVSMQKKVRAASAFDATQRNAVLHCTDQSHDECRHTHIPSGLLYKMTAGFFSCSPHFHQNSSYEANNNSSDAVALYSGVAVL